MNDQTYLIVFRLLHIVCGVFWTGSVLYLALFIIPAVKASGTDGARFMQQLGKTGYPTVIMIAALVTILSGFMLIWKLSNGFEKIWFTTLSSQVLCTGVAIALIAFAIGFTVSRPSVMRMTRLADAIAKSGAAPSPEQLQELMKLRGRIFVATKYIAVLLVVVVISMSIFRYVS